MEKISIYDYIQENIELSGKICEGFEFTDYLEEITNKKIELNKDNSYQIKKGNLDIEKLFGTTKIKKPEFILYATIDKLLDTLSSKDLEEYLDEKELNIVENIAEIASKIEYRRASAFSFATKSGSQIAYEYAKSNGKITILV